MAWGAILSAIFGAGVGTALVQVAAAVWRERGERRRGAAYVALQVAVSLEEFADACSLRFSDIDLYKSSQGAAGGSWSAMPPPPAYPEDSDGWRALSITLSERALTFPGRVRRASEHISFVSEIAAPEDAVDQCHYYCAELGSAALGLVSTAE